MICRASSHSICFLRFGFTSPGLPLNFHLHKPWPSCLANFRSFCEAQNAQPGSFSFDSFLFYMKIFLQLEPEFCSGTPVFQNQVLFLVLCVFRILASKYITLLMDIEVVLENIISNAAGINRFSSRNLPKQRKPNASGPFQLYKCPCNSVIS